MTTDKKRFVFAERKKALQIAAVCGLSVVEEQQELRGYQIYIVEQWICDRKAPSNVVKVFTGDNSHVIQVAVIAISIAELQHPRPQIQTLLDLGAHLKPKSTDIGEILLTNPGELPFDMDMVLIPDGDYDKWVNRIYVNINLRRTNCTGRSSLDFNPPNPASEEKFRSLYKIADTVNFEEAVINLVSLVQISLYLFKLLDKDYIDGLICNETNQAFGLFYEKYDPIKTNEYTLKESWMEPHLLAAIISKLLVCRNKLQESNFTTIKDPFADYDSFRFHIGDYQRSKNIRPSKFIDLETLAKLNEHVNQMKVRKVIKSKLDDISGVTNSPLFTETSDPETFRHHATIDSLRVIWRPRLKGIATQATDPPSTSELKHMLKRTTKTSGAAAVDMLSRVAGSLPWKDNHKSSNSSKSPTSVILSSPQSSDINRSSIIEDTLSRKSSPITPSKKVLSPDNLDQDIPSYVQQQSIPPLKLTISRSTETRSQHKGDEFPSNVQPSSSRHARSASDSVLLDTLFTQALRDATTVDSLRETSFDENHPLLIRSKSITLQQKEKDARPIAYMDVQTYLMYERLYQQQKELQKTHQDIKALADAYESTAKQLKEAYEKRSAQFDRVQKASRHVMDDQADTERRLKHVEDHSAKLHYELKVLNDKLKDIEDNVGTFYSKVSVLEKRMDHSQQSITTMLIIGNYFKHYWVKLHEWFTWAQSSS